jgi:hypothetical protein
MSASLSSIPAPELPHVLHALKSYRKMLKEMWDRASSYFFTDMSRNYRAQYDPSMDMALVESYVLATFASQFALTLSVSDIAFSPNTSLVSGVRVFAWDDMVDVTYKNIENTLKQL